ncbi:MAG TPA: prepilin peptidase [Candidatus Binatia bacterium]|nr:prepilin peptidase [Candidatus Binatia bacterium]
MDFTIQVALVVTVVIAAVTDIIGQRVPNWLTLSALLLAVTLHTIASGTDGLLFSLAGFGAGFALLIPFYALGGMGAGDVKLLAAVGAFMGAKQVLWVFIFAGLFGGLYAVGLLVMQAFQQFGAAGAAKDLQTHLKTIVLTGGDVRSWTSTLRSYPKLRYAVVIALGVAVTRFFEESLL